jgi:1,4-alpha-glucan branching enzyme
MYEAFGAVVTDDSVEFRLFFPDNAQDAGQYSRGGLPKIKRLQVTGDFQPQLGSPSWDLASAPEMARQDHPKGMLYTFRIDHLPDGFYQYKYFVTYENQTTRWCGDPCTKYVATERENAAFVVGGNDMKVRAIEGRLPLEDLVIYELMIDDFTAGFRGDKAPVDAVGDKIDHLLALGVNAVEFMPWTAWRGGGFNWGYDPYLFFAVENRYIEDPTNPLDRLFRLKRLVDEFHRRGIHVIMDGVFNQLSEGAGPGAGFPYYWLYQDPADSPYIGGFSGAGFDDEIDYHNGCTQEFIGDVCKFWLDEYQLDGIRFDYSLGYYIPGDTTQGIPRLVGDIKAHLAGQGRSNVSLVLEHLTDNRYEAVDATNAICATGCWYDRFLYDVPQYAAGGNIDTRLMRVLDTRRDFAAAKGPVPYVDNHDHSTVVSRVGGRGVWWKVQPALIALLTCPGGVLLRNGQEFGEDAFVPDGGADRVKARPLHWDLLGDATGQSLFTLHQKLIALRKESPALRGGNFYPGVYDEQWTHFNDQGYGVDVDLDVAIYHRWAAAADGQVERFIVVVNFSGYDQYVDVPFSVNGTWSERLNGGDLQVSDFRVPNLLVTSHWGKVFYKKG